MNNIEFIKDFCERYNIRNYTINDDLSIDVDDDVDLDFDPFRDYNKLNYIPIKFNKVSGYFSCFDNNLTSLKNCPTYVGKNFSCDENNLTSLEHSPEFVGGSFDCYFNPLKSLDGLKVSYKKLYFDNKNKLIRKHKLKQFISI